MPHLSSYLLALRMRQGLSQPELADLLDLTASALCRFEKASRRPSAELIAGVELIFGQPARQIFPAFYAEVEQSILARARAQHGSFFGRSEAAATRKAKTLADIVRRGDQISLEL